MNRSLPCHSFSSNATQSFYTRHGNIEGYPAAPGGIVNNDDMDIDRPSDPTTNDSLFARNVEVPSNPTAATL